MGKKRLEQEKKKRKLRAELAAAAAKAEAAVKAVKLTAAALKVAVGGNGDTQDGNGDEISSLDGFVSGPYNDDDEQVESDTTSDEQVESDSDEDECRTPAARKV